MWSLVSLRYPDQIIDSKGNQRYDEIIIADDGAVNDKTGQKGDESGHGQGQIAPLGINGQHSQINSNDGDDA